MRHGAYYVAILACLSIAACASPTGPSSHDPSDPAPIEVVRLDGAWRGTYSITRAEPSNCGVVTGCSTDTTVRLTLDAHGDALRGQLDMGQAGRFDVTGQVTDRTQLTLTGTPVIVEIPCTGRPTVTGQSSLTSWSAVLVGGKTLVGAFASEQFRLFNVGGTNLCPSGLVRYFGENLRLTRVP